MFSKEIPFGHSTSHAPVLEHAPKPSFSACFTIFKTRSLASTCPCGNKAYWETLADTNREAEAFLQAATHAPQPIQVAASKAASAFSFSIGIALASCVFPEVLTET